ncbi:hypothetical protein M408DRAFT_326071 [Serendipita vermifera MAFF 305830]|uniref:Uncharacterized protein n=1 Tax=Serendipita vermifera MAFF 305830 TaxID=933852 RepID=A0A0C2X5A7_SERVB|nr:hypothetical protein M408DRAFT_326071 [Serendipita vermifera MAFF 305830]
MLSSRPFNEDTRQSLGRTLKMRGVAASLNRLTITGPPPPHPNCACFLPTTAA